MQDTCFQLPMHSTRTWQESSLFDSSGCCPVPKGCTDICLAQKPLLEVDPLPGIHDPEVVQRLHRHTRAHI